MNVAFLDSNGVKSFIDHRRLPWRWICQLIGNKNKTLKKDATVNKNNNFTKVKRSNSQKRNSHTKVSLPIEHSKSSNHKFQETNVVDNVDSLSISSSFDGKMLDISTLAELESTSQQNSESKNDFVQEFSGKNDSDNHHNIKDVNKNLVSSNIDGIAV